MQTLSTGKILGIIIGLIGVAGAGYLLTQNSTPTIEELSAVTEPENIMAPAVDAGSKDAAKPMNGVMAEETKKTSPAPAAKGSFKDLLGMAGAQKCDVSQSSNMSKSTGTFYFSGGKGRGMFESTVLSGPGAGIVAKTSMIMDGETIHAWDEATKQGMKMSVVETPEAGGAVPNTVAEQWNQAYDYHCESWKADSSMFVLPTGIVFMDIAEMMKGMGMPSR